MDENSSDKNEVEFKIITLGDMGVGKTSIIQRFVFDDFEPNRISTMGVSFSFRVLKVNNRYLKLKLIDTGGQEKYRSLAVNYLKHADVVLFVFDLNVENSFDSIQYWIDIFNENGDGRNIKARYLIGNKCDLEQKVPQDLIDQLVNKNGLLYMATSAKTKNQIDEMFQYIADELCEYLVKNEKKNSGGNSQKGKVLSKTKVKKPKNNRNCC